MTEFALAIPIFCALLFGSLDMGMLYKTHSAYQEAAQEAVRAGSAVGASDVDALGELQAILSTENLNSISSVQIYDATVGAPLTATTAYTYSASLHTFVCAATGTPPSITPCTGGWAPSVRRTTVGALDSIGIKIAYKYQSLMGFFAPLQLTQTASVQMEPSTY